MCLEFGLQTFQTLNIIQMQQQFFKVIHLDKDIFISIFMKSKIQSLPWTPWSSTWQTCTYSLINHNRVRPSDQRLMFGASPGPISYLISLTLCMGIFRKKSKSISVQLWSTGRAFPMIRALKTSTIIGVRRLLKLWILYLSLHVAVLIFDPVINTNQDLNPNM